MIDELKPVEGDGTLKPVPLVLSNGTPVFLWVFVPDELPDEPIIVEGK